MAKVLKLLLIRHGATKLNNDDNSVDRIRGWKDIPLSEEGKAEAERLAGEIKKSPPDTIYSSDLKRAHDTAKAIGKATDLKVTADRAFRPWNVGKMAGQKSSKAVPILARYATKTPRKKLPEGESFEDFKHRFFEGLYKISDEKGIVAVVTHHRGERLLKAWAAEGFPPNGKIDMKVFNSKGEPTGSYERIDIPIEALKKAAKPRSAGSNLYEEAA